MKKVHICMSRNRFYGPGNILELLPPGTEGQKFTFAYIPEAPSVDSEMTIFARNLELIRAADEVVIFWDGTSHGCLIELGAALALDKPVKIDSLASVGARWAAELPLRPNDLKPQQESEL